MECGVTDHALPNVKRSFASEENLAVTMPIRLRPTAKDVAIQKVRMARMPI